MIDASHEPFAENVAITRRVADHAHQHGISVDESHACLTDPDEAKEFVERSHCDSLACAIGTSHGAYKFSGSQGIHFDRLQAIQQQLPGFPLVMHGSSSVPR